MIPLSTQVGVNEALLRYTGLDGIELPLAQKLGAKWMRVDANLLAQNSWVGIAPTTSTGYNSAAPPLINALKTQCTAAGMSLIVTITAPISASSVNGTSFSPADCAAAMAWIAGQCPGIHWELLNEPNIPYLSVTYAQYVAICQAAYPAMKAADPTCTVIAGVLSNPYATGTNGQAYLSALYPLGFHGYYDILSVHTYFNVNPPFPSSFDPGSVMTVPVQQLQALMAANGDSATPLWVTEFGWTTAGGTSVSTAQQASFICQWLIEMQQLGIPVGVIYDLQGNDNPGWGIVDGSYNLRPAFNAVQNLIKLPKDSLVFV